MGGGGGVLLPPPLLFVMLPRHLSDGRPNPYPPALINHPGIMDRAMFPLSWRTPLCAC